MNNLLKLFFIIVSSVAIAFRQNQAVTLSKTSGDRDHLVFDFRGAHNFAGLGAQIWVGARNQSVQDAALQELHTRYVRVDLGGQISLDSLKAQHDFSVEDLVGLLQKGDTPGQKKALAKFAEEMKTLGTEMHFVYFHFPSCWLISKGPLDNRINSEYMQNTANWVTAQLLFAKSYGLVPSHIEFTNEPDGNWDAQFTPGQYDAYLVAIRNALDKYGLQDIKVAGPGTGTLAGIKFLTAIVNNGNGALLDVVSFHCYDRSVSAERFPETSEFTKPLLQKLAPGTQLFITEYNNSASAWGKPPYKTGMGSQQKNQSKRDPDNGRDSADFAISSLGDALKLIAYGANSIFFWEAMDQSWGDTNMGLIGVEGNEKPVLQAMKMVFAPVPWDMPAVGAKGDPDGIGAVAFKTPDGIRLTIVNLVPNPRSVQVSFQGLDWAPGTISDVRAFNAKEGKSAVVNEPTLSEGLLSGNLPERSITSFLLKKM